MSINELSITAKVNAFYDFMKFNDEMGHDGGHTFEQFIEVSTINGWTYDVTGKFIG